MEAPPNSPGAALTGPPVGTWGPGGGRDASLLSIMGSNDPPSALLRTRQSESELLP